MVSHLKNMVGPIICPETILKCSLQCVPTIVYNTYIYICIVRQMHVCSPYIGVLERLAVNEVNLEVI